MQWIACYNLKYNINSDINISTMIKIKQAEVFTKFKLQIIS